MLKRRLNFRRKKNADGEDAAKDPSGSGDAKPQELQAPLVANPSSPPNRPTQGRSVVSTSALKTDTANLTLLSTRSLTISEPLASQRAKHTQTRGQDPLGLSVVHRPPKDRTADIVFVHGLGGSSKATWSKDRNTEFFWPGLFLPREPDIRDARVLTFGYNANFGPGSRGNKKVSILDFAKNLLYDLKFGKDDLVPDLKDLGIGEKPIIFVAHSMGGLIVKEAYLQGQHDPIYESIIKAVSSIVFLSTPHRGSNLAETLNRILQVSFLSSPMQFIAELAGGSQALQKLNEQFRHIAPKLKIVSLYETRPTTVVKSQIMVLEKDSSVLGYPGEISKPLDADHHGVCKFGSTDDPGYVTLRNILISLVGQQKPTITMLSEIEDVPPSSHDFRAMLSVAESPEADYNFFHDRWVSGTCQWILQDPAFRDWIGDPYPKPRVLWVHGNAASGKSTLSSFIIDRLFHLNLPCHYFFIRFTHLKKRALNIVLRSLACQLAESIPSYAAKIRQLEPAFPDIKSADFRTVWQWLFKQTLLQLDIHYPLYLVIDGVDEADNPGALIKLFSELHLTTIPLRVLVVSRKTHEISSAFQKLGRQVHMETIRTEGNIEDLRFYISQEMDLAGEDSYRQEVTAKLLDRARGNFLWVHLAVQKINSCYTKVEVVNALNDLPPGMEALYDRMAASVLSGCQSNEKRLGQDILGWVTCAQRVLTVEELSDALHNDGVLDLQRAIGGLCGSFVVLDHDGMVVLIHETAREYLLQPPNEDRPLSIPQKATNDMLFKRCIMRLIDPSIRSQVTRNQLPGLLEYATTAWFYHFSLGTISDPGVLETVVKFLQGPQVLTWINIAARRMELKTLVVASRYLTNAVILLRKSIGIDNDGATLAHHQAVSLLEGWATDLVKIVGKFGNNLKQYPDSIFKLIPTFCPSGSVVYQQFGRKESKALKVSGITRNTWDDCLARLSFPGVMAAAVLAAGNRIAVLTNIGKTGQIIIYNASTFEEQRQITHPERVFMIHVSTLGDLLVSYGYITTRVWDLSTGDCLKTVHNPPKRPRPHTLYLNEKLVLVGNEDRCIRTFSLNDQDTQWQTVSQIDEESLEFTTVNFPICSALSPGGDMIVFGYRGHPATAWEVNHPPMLLGQCNIGLDAADMTIQDSTWGEAFRVLWHPFSGEILGLTQVGLLFKWDPYEEQPRATVQTGADYIAISREGSLIATGDGVGTIKILSFADFSLLYQLSSQDPVIHLSFSTDSRRLYDIRGTYGNIWEPNTLVRLAGSAEYADHNSDAASGTQSLAKVSLQTEHHFARVDSVIALAGQEIGPLYCYGTEDGVAVLCEVGRGKVCDLERLTSYTPIEKLVWSEDGHLIAILDLNGRLLIKRILKSGENPDTWTVRHESDFIISSSEKGHITELIFHPTGHGLFAATSKALFSIDLDSHSVTESTLPPTISKVKWVFHPSLADYLLAFGNTHVRVFRWSDLCEIESHPYFPPRLEKSVTISREGRSGSLQSDTEILGRLICDADSLHVLLEISQRSSTSGQIDSQYLLFNLQDMKLHSALEPTEAGKKELAYTLLPKEVASRMQEPLAFLSRRRLVFLDVESWICTWRVPIPGVSFPRTMRPNGQEGVGIEQYYFLPSDWIATNEAHLCTIMPDGTLLCPQNGDVVTVQCAKLRK